MFVGFYIVDGIEPCDYSSSITLFHVITFNPNDSRLQEYIK